MKSKSLDEDLQEVQRTHVVKISPLFLPKELFFFNMRKVPCNSFSSFIFRLHVGLSFLH